MICAVCGKQLRDGAKFCVNCGAAVKIKATQQEKQQPQELFDADEIKSEDQSGRGKETTSKKHTRTSGVPTAAVTVLVIVIAVVGAIFWFMRGANGWNPIVDANAHKTAEKAGKVDIESDGETEAFATAEIEEADKTEIMDTTAETIAPGETETESVDGSGRSGEETENISQETPGISEGCIIGATASSNLAEYNMVHLPSYAIDGDLSTAWVEGVSGQGIGESIHFMFDGTYVVSGMVIYAGYQKSATLYRKNSRPKEIRIDFHDGESETCVLEDLNSEQRIDFDHGHTSDGVTISLQSVYEGDVYQDTCLSELYFY